MTTFHGRPVDRRAALVSMTSVLAAMADAPLLVRHSRAAWVNPVHERGRRNARPAPPTAPTSPGTHKLGFRRTRDGVLYLPPQYRHDTPIPLVLLLHGAGGSGAGAAQRL